MENAGIAAVTFFEKLVEQLSDDEMCEILDRAHDHLKASKNAVTRNRLTESAFRALSLRHVSRPDWTNFSLDEKLRRHQARYIQMALEDAGGVISRAARLLGLSGHQNLQYMLKNLRNVGTISVEESRSVDEGSGHHTATLKLIHVEDDQTVAPLIQKIAEHEGWQLKHFTEGSAALIELASDIDCDVLLVDNELPGLNGLDLVRQARSMAHRANMRIVMVSGMLDEAAARDAGADAFLRKPQDIQSLVTTISRLLTEHQEDG